MASISIQTRLVDVDDAVVVDNQLNVTTSGEGVDSRRINITTGEVTHTIDSGIGNAGYCYVKNRDASNFVELGFATTVYNIKLLAGQSALFPLTPAQSALYLKADTAACDCDIIIREV
jgi:hypothetical protein